MFGNMKDVIEQNAPILNRINPAAVLSDAYYCISVYNDTLRYQRMYDYSADHEYSFLGIAFLGVRRERYDSILKDFLTITKEISDMFSCILSFSHNSIAVQK